MDTAKKKRIQAPWSSEARERHAEGVRRYQQEVKIQNFARKLSAAGTLELLDAARRGGLDVAKWLREQIERRAA